jgi:hypothetical protein
METLLQVMNTKKKEGKSKYSLANFCNHADTFLPRMKTDESYEEPGEMYSTISCQISILEYPPSNTVPFLTSSL